jgi:ABC-type Fe3+-hydroxamate transport system substrate-binding protein
MKRILLLCVPLLLLLPGPAGAQGLGDAARRERQKRQTVPPKTEEPRVFDNDDLNAGKPPKKEGEGEAAPDAAAPPAASSEQPSDEDVQKAVDRERVAQAEKAVAEAAARLATAQARVQELKDKLNPMSPSFVFGAANAGMAAPGADMRIREELQQAELEAVEAEKAVEDARREREDARAQRPRAGAR